MPGDQPFIPVIGSVVGKSVVIAATVCSSNTGNAVIDSTGGYASSMLVTNVGTVTLFVRMSTEAVPLAGSTDLPISPNSQRIFENPNPTGKTGVAVAASIFGAGTAVIFTPGNAGVE
jgi:hypothetical protein